VLRVKWLGLFSNAILRTNRINQQKKNNITKDNINDYEVKIEAVGLLIKMKDTNKTYPQEELLKDASYQVVITNI
jgi:hypothetical protein